MSFEQNWLDAWSWRELIILARDQANWTNGFYVQMSALLQKPWNDFATFIHLLNLGLLWNIFAPVWTAYVKKITLNSLTDFIFSNVSGQTSPRKYCSFCFL